MCHLFYVDKILTGSRFVEGLTRVDKGLVGKIRHGCDTGIDCSSMQRVSFFRRADMIRQG